MSEDRHLVGPVISVPADDDGLLTCALCQEPLDAQDAWMLLRRPSRRPWDAICRPCTFRVMGLAAAATEGLDLVDIVQAILA
jgi:hypothetical protein